MDKLSTVGKETNPNIIMMGGKQPLMHYKCTELDKILIVILGLMRF